MLIALRSPKAGERRALSQCRKPTGWFGRLVIRSMNRGHAKLTAWGLGHVTIGPGDVVLDVGCGGGRTVGELAGVAIEGRVCGLDHSETCVAAARRHNRRGIAEGRVEVREGTVSALPWADATFDLVTAVETHFWWPDIPLGLREVRRVLKLGGRVLLVAEFYNGGKHARYAERLSAMTGMAALTVEEHRALLAQAGFTAIDLFEHDRRGWLCARAAKPAPA